MNYFMLLEQLMNNLQLGKWRVICDRCGFKRYSDQVQQTWDGYIVCSPSTGKTCFETRHPQDFVRSVKDDQSVPFTRPEPADVYADHSNLIASSVGTQEPTIPSGTSGNGSAL